MFVKLNKADFTGKAALTAQKAQGVPRKLVGFEMIERGIPRSHYPLAINGEEIGFVTSGSFSPTLEKNIGLGLIATEHAQLGQEIEVVVRGQGRKSENYPHPFLQAVLN